MDLTPLYDLRERLKAGAVAGTALLGEDFRLARALEGLGPLEGVSPVFQKLGQGVRTLLSPDCPDRAAALLDALSLCDAVCTTQGAVGVSGPVEPLGLVAAGETLVNAPYSLLNPLVEALTGTGGGRFAPILENREQHPELFRDYRVKHALVAALGASYAELAEKAAEWLIEDGPSAAPLLKEGFDPNGKKEMARRIHVLESVRGGAENDFYLSLLDGGCEKEVRGAAAYALRHDEGNAHRLVSLCKTEKGPAKKSAHWALAQLESDTAWSYWNELAAKNPQQVAEYMVGSGSLQASELVGRMLCQALLEPQPTTPFMEGLELLLRALEGKHGPEICAFYRKAPERAAALEAPLDDSKKPYFFPGTDYGSRSRFGEALPSILLRTLIIQPHPELCALAEELFETHGAPWMAPALMAALLTRDAGGAYEAAKPLLEPGFSLFPKKEEKEAMDSQLDLLLQPISWNGEKKRYLVRLSRLDPQENRSVTVETALTEPLDPRWFTALCKRGSRFDAHLICLMDPENPETRELLAKHFYNLAMITSDNLKYLQPLIRLDWTKFEGMLTRHWDGQKRLSFWDIQRYLLELPLTAAQKVAELEPLLKQVEAGKVGFQGRQGVKELTELIARIKTEG